MPNAVSAVHHTHEAPFPGPDERVAGGSEARDEALAIVGHDLRTPLHTIRVTVALLRERGLLPEDACCNLERIDRAADRMLEMIASLVDFAESRFTGALRVARAPADLYEVCRGAIDELAATAPRRRVDLDVAGDVRGKWDPARLAQVVSNLVANALAHGGGSGPVKVSVRGEDDDVVLSVHNSGPAIAAERVAVLFQPFRAASKLRESRHERGLGLGLYIVKNIVTAHGGAVTVRSSDADGTVFTVRLPRATRDRAGGAPEEQR